MSVLYSENRPRRLKRMVRDFSGLSCNCTGMSAIGSATYPETAQEWVSYIPSYFSTTEGQVMGTLSKAPLQVDRNTGLTAAQIDAQKKLALESLQGGSGAGGGTTISQTVVQQPTQNQASGSQTDVGSSTQQGKDLLSQLGDILKSQQPGASASPTSVSVTTGDGGTTAATSSPLDFFENKWVLIGLAVVIVGAIMYSKKRK